MKRALITGVTGQDGAYLAELLLGAGYDVFGSTRTASSADLSRLRSLGIAQRIKLVELDPTRLEVVEATLRTVEPTEIYHLAGPASVAESFVDPAASFQAIAGGTLGMLEGLRRHGRTARLVVAGSAEIFGDHADPSDEHTPVDPLTPYAAGKAAAWALVKSYRRSFGLWAATAILYSHESPLRPSAYVTQKVARAVAAIRRGSLDTLALGNLSVIRDWGWAPEFMAALQAMASREEPEDFVLATGESHSLGEFVELAFATAGLNARDHVSRDPALIRAADVPIMRANPDKARRLLGFQPRVRFRELVENLVNTALAG